jgi:hypothetical protein
MHTSVELAPALSAASVEYMLIGTEWQQGHGIGWLLWTVLYWAQAFERVAITT